MTPVLHRSPAHRPALPDADRLPALEGMTRRDVLRGAAALLLATACDTAGVPAAQTPPTPATRSVDHALGTTDIPVAPQRLVTLNPFAILDALVAVDITPIGSSGDPAADYPYASWLRRRTDGVALVGFTGEEDLERITLLEPDLILANPWQEDTYAELSDIAPTVGVPLSYEDYLTEFRAVADLVGRNDKADELVADHRAHIRETRTALGELTNLTVSVLRVFPDRLQAGGGGYVFTLLDALGFSRPHDQRGPHQVELSTEQLDRVDADVLFVYSAANAADEADNRAARTALFTNPLWRRLDAVHAGRAFEVDSQLWAGGGLLWAQAMLDDVRALLLDRQPHPTRR